MYAIRSYYANIELTGDDYDKACEMAIAFAHETGGYFIHPFDNPEVIAGQGTLFDRAIAARDRSGLLATRLS